MLAGQTVTVTQFPLQQEIQQAMGEQGARHLLYFLEDSCYETDSEPAHLLRIPQPDGGTVLALRLVDVMPFIEDHALRCEIERRLNASFDAWMSVHGRDDGLARCA
jgi:hypothetical protein